MAVAVLGYGFSGQVLPVIGFRLLQGVGLAFATTCFLAVATRALPKDRIATGIWYFSLVHVVCQAVGPLIGLALADRIGYRALFLINAGLMVLGSLAASTIKPNPVRPRKAGLRFGNPIAKEALPGAVLIFLVTTAYFVVNSFLVLFAESREVSTGIGYYFTVYAVTLVAVGPVVGKVVGRLGLARVLAATMVLLTASLLLTSFSTSLWMFLVAGALQALGYGVSSPLLKALIMSSAPAERHGAASSTGNIGTDLGTLAGPVIGGFLVDRAGYAAMWQVMTVPVLLSLLLVFALRSRIDHPGEGAFEAVA
jgi:MFS family permease